MTDRCLFHASYRGRSVVIARAGTDELAALIQPVEDTVSRDNLDRWSLIAIRDPGRDRVNIHALGWRIILQTTWITSRLVSLDLGAQALATLSGHVYLLGKPDSPELDPELRDHLAYALSHWAFDDVRSWTNS